MQKSIDLLDGAYLALITVPVALATAYAGGVPARQVLVATAAASFAMFAFGGRRTRIVAPTLLFAPLIAACVRQHGIETLIAAGVLAGLLQIAIGLHGVGRAFASAPAGALRGLAVAAAGSVLLDLAAGPTSLPEWHPRAERFLSLGVPAVALLAIEMTLLLALLSRSDRKLDARDDIGLGLTNTASALLCGIPHAPARDRGARSVWFAIGHAVVVAACAATLRVDLPRVAMVMLVFAAAVAAVEPARLAREVLRSRLDALSAMTIVLATIALGFGRAILITSVIALAAFARAKGRLSVRVREGSTTEAAVAGELFFASRGELAPLANLDPVPASIVIDASDVTLIDASGVDALAQVIDSLRARGCSVTVRASAQLQSLLADSTFTPV